MLYTSLRYLHIIVSVLLVIAILIQNRSAGLSATFGGSGGQISTTKRGAEKVVFKASIVLAILFVLSSVAFLFVR